MLRSGSGQQARSPLALASFATKSDCPGAQSGAWSIFIDRSCAGTLPKVARILARPAVTDPLNIELALLDRSSIRQGELNWVVEIEFPVLDDLPPLAASISAAMNADLPIAVTILVILAVACAVDHPRVQQSASVSARPHV